MSRRLMKSMQAFRERFEAVGLPFQSLKLEHSFRSSPAVLDFVDAALLGLDAAALGAEVVAHRLSRSAAGAGGFVAAD